MKKWETADPTIYDLLKANATQMRNNPTEAESALWQYLKSSQLGVKFLRQHIIGEYIVDFLCRRNNLVIEIDGGYHFTEEQQKEDEIRTIWLEQHGYHVIRFTNEQVLFDTDNTIEIIKEHIQ